MRRIRRGVFVMALGILACTAVWAAQETKEQYQGAEAEQFLAKARVTSLKDLGTGVTLPQKAVLSLNGVNHNAVFKTIDESKPFAQFAQGGGEIAFQDSWQTEIAGYVVDRIIGLGMVPATIERSINGKTGSIQWWVESMMPEAERVKQKVNPPDPEAWSRVTLKMHLFDQLIYNTDRHANNILVTKDFDLRLIDHSRAFRPFKQLKDAKQLTRFSKSLLDGLGKLEEKELKKRIGRYLSAGQITALLQRRDAIVALAAKAVAERGEAAVLY